jgi:hypothetical protein
MQERRTAPVERRVARRIPFVAAVRHKVGFEVQLALAQDLGPDGLKLKLPAGRAYLPRTPVTLTFELPDGGELVRARGDIVFERGESPAGTRRSAAGGYQISGVRFTELSPLDHARILRILRLL